MGSTDVQVVYEGQTVQMPLRGDGPTLLGRNWLSQLKLNWEKIHQVSSPSLCALLSKYDKLFQEGLGTFKDHEAKIEIDPNATPRFCKARTVPYVMREKVEEELDRLVTEGTLVPLDYSDWAAPIVAVMKSDRRSVRICGDFRMTLNPVSQLNRYPIPKTEDSFATVKQGKLFTKLAQGRGGVKQGCGDKYPQGFVSLYVPPLRYLLGSWNISENHGAIAARYCTCYSVVYIDDILIATESEDEHLQILEEVCARLAKADLKVKKHKCKFMVRSVPYLGHVIDGEGLHPLPEKVEGIRQAPTPKNVTELKSYLGLLTYYGKFLPNLSTRLAPLYLLLRQKEAWKWTAAQDKAFKESKELLTSSNLLVHFNSDFLPAMPLHMALALFLHVGCLMALKSPLAMRRVPLTLPNEVLEKEGLSLVFGIKRFYSYLFGHSFTLITDHKPLLGLLDGHKPTSPQASARIRCWSLYLSMFEYKLKFRSTSDHANADALSRLPLPVEPVLKEPPPEIVLLVDQLENSPITARQIQECTRKDPLLARVLQFVQQGWPRACPEPAELTPFFEKRLELSVYNGCLLWGNRVVVPVSCRDTVLAELHGGHPGATRMKGLSRMYVWWPGITKDIEQTIRECDKCQLYQSTPPVAPLQPWNWPTRPWARLHIDYAGPVNVKMILVIVDAHSKWIEAVCTPSATSAVVIEELRTLFAQFGIPETIVSDNGTCFVSSEIESFFAVNGVKHLTSAPYHPASNGLAERAVQIVKKGLKKNTRGSMRTRLAQVLFSYRLTPQSTTGVHLSPTLKFLLRHPRSCAVSASFDFPQFDRPNGVSKGLVSIVDDDLTTTRSGKTGPVSYRVKLTTGGNRRCHQDQARKRFVEGNPPTEANCELGLPDFEETPTSTEPSAPKENTPTESNANGAPEPPDETVVSPTPTVKV